MSLSLKNEVKPHVLEIRERGNNDMCKSPVEGKGLVSGTPEARGQEQEDRSGPG